MDFQGKSERSYQFSIMILAYGLIGIAVIIIGSVICNIFS